MPAMSPSTITALTGCGRVRASSAAPAAPTEALVDASTIERCCVCDESSCASSSSTAVPERSATAPTWVESRWATITIEPGVRPASVPVTVSISRGPSTVCALNTLCWTWSPSCLNDC